MTFENAFADFVYNSFLGFTFTMCIHFIIFKVSHFKTFIEKI